MAAKPNRKEEKKELFPSTFGSHKSMIHEESLDKDLVKIDGKDVQIGQDQVVLRDQYGLYVTLKNRLDTGLADPNRYDAKRQAIQQSLGLSHANISGE